MAGCVVREKTIFLLEEGIGRGRGEEEGMRRKGEREREIGREREERGRERGGEIERKRERNREKCIQLIPESGAEIKKIKKVLVSASSHKELWEGQRRREVEKGAPTWALLVKK